MSELAFKPLEWKDFLDGHDEPAWNAYTPIGYLHVHLKGGKFEFWFINWQGEHSESFDLLSKAQEAAEKFYHKRMMEGLVVSS